MDAQEKIEITPEMITEGSIALRDYDPDSERRDDAAIRIFKTILVANPLVPRALPYSTPTPIGSQHPGPPLPRS